MAEINKELLEHLARLARIELDEKEEPKLLSDLVAILNYFKELEALDTTGVVPMDGGTQLKNVFREDEAKQPFPDDVATKEPLTVPAVFTE